MKKDFAFAGWMIFAFLIILKWTTLPSDNVALHGISVFVAMFVAFIIGYFILKPRSARDVFGKKEENEDE